MVNLEFGQTFSDHMYVADFENGEWQPASIEPYGNFALSPANPALHYGQALFEGLKAYKTEDGEICIFRPEANLRRLNISADRLCMPAYPEELFIEGLKELLRLDADWIPTTPGSSLASPTSCLTAAVSGPSVSVRPSGAATTIIPTAPAPSGNSCRSESIARCDSVPGIVKLLDVGPLNASAAPPSAASSTSQSTTTSLRRRYEARPSR